MQDLLNYVPKAGLLQDRVVLITGAAMGIGRAVARVYAHYGATVVLLDKQSQHLDAAYDEIVADGSPEPLICALDLQQAEPSAYEQLAEMLYSELGRLDGLVLNAAFLGAFMPLKQHDVALWNQMLTVNLNANFHLLRTCLPLLERSPDAAVIFSSDHSSKAYYGGYGVSKGALDALCDLVVAEYSSGAHFIRANRINSGPLRTRLRVLNFPGESAEQLAVPEAVIGPYLYFMGADAGQRTGEAVNLERLPAEFVWPGMAALQTEGDGDAG